MHISGLAIRNYRSIGDEGVTLKPWKGINILVGRNNSGKSNVIRAVKLIAAVCGEQKGHEYSALDLHQRSPQSKFSFDIEIHVAKSDNEQARKIASLLGRSQVEFTISVDSQGSISYNHWSGEDVQDFGQANELFALLGNQRWTSRVDAATIQKVMHDRAESAFSRFRPAIPKVHTIPEFRQIRPGESYTLDGQNLVGLLAEYQNPEIGQDELREKFDRIERFLQHLLHLPAATLDVTRKEQQLVINDDGLRLPLSSFGTGTHELVIMLTAVLANDGELYCIEEPEIHMHARLQKEFIQFIGTQTKNHYLVSSHSHAFVDAVNWLDRVQVFHIDSGSGSSVGAPVLNDGDALVALGDLGVAPSDLLQTNCVVWVEGPSDKIFIRNWIQLLSPELVEGRDYSIMFYGGKLLSHIEFERDKVPDELVSLLRINQRAVVVMDSDREGPGGRLNATKERVQQECEESGGYCWVTDGREIENLVPLGPVRRVVQGIAGRDIELEVDKYGRFNEALEAALDAAGAKSLDYANNKVKLARQFSAETKAGDIPSSLNTVLQEVIAKIRSWNEYPQS